MRVSRLFGWLVLWAFFLAMTTTGRASVAICDQAAAAAAAKTGVPLDILMALTRTETGRRRNGELQPWPWTVNMEGEGRWFDSAETAQAYVFKNYKSGARSFDVGCFQVNYKWHGEAFNSVEEMFDPVKNALYAARFLKSLKTENQSWTEAAGAYHSRTPSYATKYKTRFQAVHAGLTVPEAPRAIPAAARQNVFPLLQSSQSKGRMGSLVSLGDRVARPLFTEEQG